MMVRLAAVQELLVAGRLEGGSSLARAPRGRWMAHLISAAILIEHLIAPSAQAAPPTAIRIQFTARPSALTSVLLPVRWNGKSFLSMVDTGATLSAFDSSFRRELGDPVREVRVETPHGVTRLECLKAPSATVADRVPLNVAEVCCIDLSGFRAPNGDQIYGLIGTDFFMRQIVRIDFDLGEIALLPAVPDDAGVPMPVTFSAGMPIVTATIAGAGDIAFVIDTGDCGIASGHLAKTILDEAVEGGDAQVTHTARATSIIGLHVTRGVHVREIALGGFIHRGAVFHEAALSTLGLGYLRRYVITFDFPNKTIYLKPGRAFDEPSLYDLSGAHVWRPHGATTVDFVDRYSAAEYAGLRARDVIEGIDEQRAESLTMFEIRKILCLVGEHVLRVKRGERSLEIRLMLKDLPNPWAEAEITDRNTPATTVRRVK